MRSGKCKNYFNLFVIALLVFTATASATTYYVDATDGDDSKSGTSEANAWQNLSKVNSTTFSAGDSILFQCGESWSGQLYPKGSGSSGSPITINYYGDPNNGYPQINGPGGTTRSAVFLYCQEYWEINNLDITHYDASNTDTKRLGVFIQAEDVNMPGGADTLNHIYLQGLEISNVDGNTASKQSGGILFAASGDGIVANAILFNDISIDNCYIHDVNRTGIVFWSDWSTRTLTENTTWTPWTNVVVKNNTVESSYQNGMIIRMCDSPLIENNTYISCAFGGSGNAMFFFNCDNAVAQYNEGYGTVYNSGDADAAAFDSDYQCKNTLFQYNYSHDNQLAGIVAVCGNQSSNFNDGTVFRYNVLENNDKQGIRNSGKITNTTFYNNTIYIGSDLSSVQMVYQKAWSGVWPDGTKFYNNIFYNDAINSSYEFGSATNNEFDNNVFYGNAATGEPSDANKITSDPNLVDPGTGYIGLGSCEGYMIKDSGSPCVDAGIVIDGDNGGFDFWGKAVPYNGTPDIGAHEYRPFSGGDNTAPSPDPMTWDLEPVAVSAVAIEMVATIATDDSSYEYYFNNVTDPNHDSGWSSSVYYKDTGLAENASYTYQVNARDRSSNQNATAYSTQKSATTLIPATATIYEKFGSNPTSGGGWVDAGAGNTTFDYNSAGYLDVIISRDSANPANYYKMLDTVFDKTQECWFEMDLQPTGAAWDFPSGLFGIFDYNTSDNHHNVVADRFSYKQYEGQVRGNRHDTYGWDTAGTVLSGNGAPYTPGITYGDNVRAKGHYWYTSGAGGQATVTVYEIDPNDGSTGAQIMATGTVSVIGSGGSLSFDMFGIGNRTEAASSDNNRCKIDNLYFSVVQANPDYADPNFSGSGGGCTPAEMYVDSIVCSTVNVGGGNKKGRATVTIYNDCGNPLQNADVDGTFTGDFDESVTDVTTNASGVAVLDTVGTAKGSISFTFCVDDVTHATLPYDANDNVETCDNN